MGEKLFHPLWGIAREIGEQYATSEERLFAATNHLHTHFETKTGGFKKPVDIFESRYTTSRNAYDKKLSSCGTFVRITALLLRIMGEEAHLIHGEIPESSDHAWIKLKIKETGEWKQYETFTNEEVSASYIPLAEATAYWEQIAHVIYESNENRAKRRNH